MCNHESENATSMTVNRQTTSKAKDARFLRQGGDSSEAPRLLHARTSSEKGIIYSKEATIITPHSNLDTEKARQRRTAISLSLQGIKGLDGAFIALPVTLIEICLLENLQKRMSLR